MRELTVFIENGPISLELFYHIEKQLGYKLPKTYRELVTRHDGLIPEENFADFIDIYGGDNGRDVNFYSYQEIEGEEFILDYQQVSDEIDYGIKHLVSFADCANGDCFCFDYRENPKGDNPKIVLVFHDDYEINENGEDTMVVNFVANNFDEFLNNLYNFDERYGEELEN